MYAAVEVEGDTPEARQRRVVQRLYVRSMSETTTRRIPDTEYSQGSMGEPGFSPDGQSLVFFTATDRGFPPNGVLKRMNLAGGAATTLCEVETPLGMSWSGDHIVFGQRSKGVMRVPANGGKPEVLVAVKDNEAAQGPQLLQGGRSVLFTLATGITDPLGPGADVWDKASIVVQSLESGKRKTLIDGGSDARYVPTGHLVYALEGTLLAVPFDAARLEVLGDPVRVVEGVARSRLGAGVRYRRRALQCVRHRIARVPSGARRRVVVAAAGSGSARPQRQHGAS